MKRKGLTFLIVSILILSFCYVNLNIVPMAEADPDSDTWQVSLGSDDCLYVDSLSVFYLSELYHGAGAYSEVNYDYRTGARFQTLTIPQGSTIESAYFNITCKTVYTGVPVLTKIRAEAIDDASTFSTKENYLARTKTDAGVDWDIGEVWTVGVEYKSPDIKTVIQEVINREGWSSGNDLVIFWDDDGSAKTENMKSTKAYEEGAETAPRLEVTWTQEGNWVELTTPNNGATETSWSVNFVFNATFYQNIQNASLHIENTTTVPTSISWDTDHWNTTSVQNKSDATIPHSFSGNGEGSYKWNIEVFNSTHGVYAISNRTVTLDVSPRYQNVDSNATSGTILLSGQGYDGIGLDWAWLSTNETGSWKNYTEYMEREEVSNFGNWQKNRASYIVGGLAFVTENLGLHVVNISDIENPSVIGYVALGTQTLDVEVDGNYAYVSVAMSNKLSVVNITDPTDPSEVGSVTDATKLYQNHGIAKVGEYVYCCAYSGGTSGYFTIVNVTDPENPTIEGSIANNASNYIKGSHDVQVIGNYAYMTASNHGVNDDGRFTIIDVSDKDNPDVVSSITSSDLYRIADVQIKGDYAYVGQFGYGEPIDHGYIRVIDISDVNNPSVVGGLADYNMYVGYIDGDTLYTVDNRYDYLNVINITNPTSPTLSNQYTVSGTTAVLHVFLTEDGNHAIVSRYHASSNEKFYVWSLEEGPENYNSPMNMSDIADTWAWSNFTWCNTSIAIGTTIQWEIFYNDTYGNVNGTGIHSFTIAEEEEGGPLFYDGFETGDFSLWDKGGDFPYPDHDVQSSIKYNGTYASWMSGTANDHHRCEKNVTLTSETVIHLQFYIRIDEVPTGPASGFIYLAGLGDTVPTLEVMLCLNTTSMNFGLQTLHDVGNYTETSMTATLQKWYLIDIYVLVEDSVYLFVDGKEEVCRNDGESLSAISNVMMIYQIGVGTGWSGNHIIYHDDVLLNDVCFSPEDEVGPVGPFGPHDHRVEINVRLNGERLKGCNVTVEGGPDNKLKWGLTDLRGILIFKLKTGNYELIATFEQYIETKSLYVSRHMTVSIDFTKEDIISPDVLPEDFEEFLAWLNLPELDLTTETLLVFILPLIVLVVYAVKKASEGPERKWKYSYLK